MAIYLNGMTAQETAQLTAAMAHSGDMVDLLPYPCESRQTFHRRCGDKTTLVVAHCGGMRCKNGKDERPWPWPYRRHAGQN
ncbi:MAG: hypothetical protein ACLRWF_01275 [Ruthenibacterium sp.]